ncbi:nuclear transcription factor Y subunit B-1-like isoform X2 [Malania oleifera]|uniref:nuclear transcription factor Y subunit B-1-like isoform X2 n=1 Tax=Malania oleifera TaxID=397392 RepID=UPI0025ADDBE3|nr:nuclear transcription factor Y subunit B-1-like isoform X2 [Malania oleifera]
MERGGSHGYHKLQKSTSGAGEQPLQPCPVREQDQYMPIANVIRIMRRILPPHAKISDDAKETIQECVSEYISFITGEANDRCQREQRKTITAEDVLWAMGKLGFDDYIEPLTAYLNRYREVETDRTSLRGEPYLKRSGAEYGGGMVGVAPNPYGLGGGVGAGLGVGGGGYPMGYHHHNNHHGGFYDGGAMGGGGYYRDASGGAGPSSSPAALPNFDPYAQYK